MPPEVFPEYHFLLQSVWNNKKFPPFGLAEIQRKKNTIVFFIIQYFCKKNKFFFFAGIFFLFGFIIQFEKNRGVVFLETGRI